MILKRERKHRITVMLIACLLFVGLFPTRALAAEYNITVNGIAVTDDNAADVLGDGTVSYDSDSNTLSLNSADLNKIVNNTGNALTITVTEDNTITLDPGTYVDGVRLIDSNAPITFNGSGSLTLDGTSQSLSVYLIGSSGNVTVDGMTMTMKNSNGAGIYSDGDIIVKNNALVQGDVGNMFYAVTGSGKLAVGGGSTITMPLEGTSVSGWMAIWVKEIEISGSTFDIAAPCGIYGEKSVKIKDRSTVNVTSTICTTNAYPAIWSGDSVHIENSTVTAVSTNYAAIYAPDVTIAGGRINAESKQDYPAILASKILTINGPITVMTATNGSSANYRGNTGTVINTSAESGDTVYKVFSGRSEQSAAETEGSPFAAATDVAETINGVNYFRIEEHTHTGGTATCSSPAICEDCGNEYGETDSANHANLQMAEGMSATHLQEGNVPHYYCDGCAKCYSDEAGTQEISFADTVIPKRPEHISDSTGWHPDADNHWNVCICGKVINEAAHTFAWVTDKEATATEAGSRHEECVICGYVKAAEVIPATGTTGTTETPAGTTGTPDTTTGTPAATNIRQTIATGDNSSIALWVTLLLLSCGGLTGVIAYSRQRKAS